MMRNKLNKMQRTYSIPFTPSQPIRNMILGMKTDARATTLNAIDKISEEELNWQYAEGWNTVSALLQHIWASEELFSLWVLDEREMTDEEKMALEPSLEMGKYIKELSNKPLQEILSKLKSSRAVFIEKIMTKDESFFTKTFGEYEENTDVAWVLYHMIEDEVHHRGQISLIRKLYRETMKNKA
jgi:uncharacterized damage-inducible protein DinB